jgi:hypothetical protein
VLSARTAGVLAALALLLGGGLGFVLSKAAIAKANQERDQAQEQLATAGAQGCVAPAPDLSRLAANAGTPPAAVASWTLHG